MKIGVIGGSGLYKMEGVGRKRDIVVETPFGVTSSPITECEHDQHQLYFLARHGRDHNLLPSEVNYRANIFAMKSLGIKHIVSISAVGSMREELKPGDFILPDQYIDRTSGHRPNTFFGKGVVGHAHFADPNCASMRSWLSDILTSLDIRCHVGGALVCIEGPQFSTRAESHLYRTWPNVAVIGMTALPEAKLARECGMCYVTLAMATDYDCWKNTKAEDVSVEAILRILKENAHNSQRVMTRMLASQDPVCSAGCKESVAHITVTDRKLWSNENKRILDVVLG